MSSKQHYFVSSLFGWATDEDRAKAVARCKRESSNYYTRGKQIQMNIYLVPLPADASYEIDYYRPVVDGVEFIEQIEVTIPKR